MARQAFPTMKCMIPDCNNKFGSGMPKGQKGGRGLCKVCHQQASALVKQGKTTWEELERLNLARPKYQSNFELHLIMARKAAKTSGKAPKTSGWTSEEELDFLKKAAYTLPPDKE